MATPLARSGRTRRTQFERRLATRVALLDAAIDCLAQEGYAGTTTRRVAQRAGVTAGALQHHFTTKAELLGAARSYLGEEFVRQMTAAATIDADSMALRTELLLDRWWEVCRGRLFQALVELWVAARTDAQLREALVAAERDNAHLYIAGGRVNYPELVDRPGFAALMQTARATIRGLAMLRLVNEPDADRAWPLTRAHLVALSSQFAGGDGSP